MKMKVAEAGVGTTLPVVRGEKNEAPTATGLLQVIPSGCNSSLAAMEADDRNRSI